MTLRYRLENIVSDARKRNSCFAGWRNKFPIVNFPVIYYKKPGRVNGRPPSGPVYRLAPPDMRVLLLTSDLPYPAARSGGGRMTLPWVRELSGPHTYSLLSLVRRGQEARLAALREIFAEVRTVPAGRGLSDRAASFRLIFTRPSPVVAAASRRFRVVLGEMLASGSYDCVQFQGFPMGQYARSVTGSVPRVLVLPDLAGEVLRQQVWLARGWKKYYYFRQWKLSRYWEKWYAIWSGNVFLTSLKDRRTVDSWDIGVRTFVMPPPLDPGLLSLPEKKPAAGRILFIGDFQRPGTIDGVIRLKEEILGRVRRECPEANCLVAGADLPESIRRLAAADFEVTGRVERVDSLPAAAALLAVPLRVAGGISLEIVEALAAGCPVVATRLANSGVGARDGREIVLADRPDDFAAAVVRLLKSPGERERLGRAGRNRVKEKFDPGKSREKMLEVYRRIAGC